MHTSGGLTLQALLQPESGMQQQEERAASKGSEAYTWRETTSTDVHDARTSLKGMESYLRTSPVRCKGRDCGELPWKWIALSLSFCFELPPSPPQKGVDPGDLFPLLFRRRQKVGLARIRDRRRRARRERE